MTALEKLIAWIETYPDFDILSNFQVDYTDQIPGSGGVFPSGLVEVSRKRDLFGRLTVTNQYNFGLYYVFTTTPGEGAAVPTDTSWIMDFQEWVQEQSVTGQAPVFGDEPRNEKIMTQEGVMTEPSEEGTVTYMVQLSVQYMKNFEEENKWLT